MRSDYSPTSSVVVYRGARFARFAKSKAALYTVPMRRLGIDLGTVRTGLAVAEDDVPVATPLCTVNHKTFGEALEHVAALIAHEQIEEAVIGLPLDLNGREGESAQRVKRFAAALAKRAKIRVHTWDERLSTVAAERSLRSQGVRGAAKRRVVDQIAATLLLQGYLDHAAGRTRSDGHECNECDEDDACAEPEPA